MSLTGKEIAQMHKDYVMQSWSKSGVDALPVERAEGIYFYDYDGKKYADMASLLVCSNLGHELPEIVEAIKKQADKMCFMAPAYASEPKSVLAKMLVELAGADTYKRVFFTNGGAESNENAIKMARMVTGRTKIFSCYRSYHGATLGASNKNALACSRVFHYIASRPGKKEVMLLMNSLTDVPHWSENVCWFYDTDFEYLADESIVRVVCTGLRCEDYKLRCLMAGVPEDRLACAVDEHDAAALMAYEPGDELYVLYGTDTLELAYQVFDQMKAIAQSRAADSADKEVQA